MPKFQIGDIILVDGFTAVLNSWPDSDVGAFHWTSTDPKTGAITEATSMIGTTNVVLASDTVDSLANFDADMAKVEAQLEAETAREQAATAAANAAQVELAAVAAVLPGKVGDGKDTSAK